MANSGSIVVDPHDANCLFVAVPEAHLGGSQWRTHLDHGDGGEHSHNITPTGMTLEHVTRLVGSHFDDQTPMPQPVVFASDIYRAGDGGKNGAAGHHLADVVREDPEQRACWSPAPTAPRESRRGWQSVAIAAVELAASVNARSCDA